MFTLCSYQSRSGESSAYLPVTFVKTAPCVRSRFRENVTFVRLPKTPDPLLYKLAPGGDNASQTSRTRVKISRTRSPVIDARAKPTVLAALALIAAPGFATADGLCSAIDTQARSTLTTEANAALFGPSSASAGTCSVTRTLSAPDGTVCQWEFDYRDPTAAQAFATFNQLLSDCFQGRAREIKDQGVNHPDFYDLRQYHLDGAAVSVSIKDKGAMRKTFVFLRIEPNGQSDGASRNRPG